MDFIESTDGAELDVVEMSIDQMLHGLEGGRFTSVDLVCAYLNRILYYDKTGIQLNSLPVLNPDMMDEAYRSDSRRRGGGPIGRLEGVPFIVKDSFKVLGLPVAAGSPALSNVIATADAATVEFLKSDGAVLIGKSNMPPMAAGGVQPGVYGYTRSPYNPDYLTSAYGSGSSFGSGTAVSASFAAFGLAEETVSSGRAPASNNALVAYTPSRGLISMRGNWPLRPTCDVVVPHTRSVGDMLRIVDVLVVDDPERRGDFWREQEAVTLPSASSVKSEARRVQDGKPLEGARLGVPGMFIGEEEGDGVDPPFVSKAVKLLWGQAAEDLRRLGAVLMPVDFPAVSNYEADASDHNGFNSRGLLTDEWKEIESGLLIAKALDDFLQVNGYPALRSWSEVDGDNVFPGAPDNVYTARSGSTYDWQRLAEIVKWGLPASYASVPGLDQAIRGLEEARKQDLEDWMESLGLDALVFPTNGDIAREDVFRRAESMSHAMKNGVVYSNGNRAIRHLGIPTVNVPMGQMSDTNMPVGLTFVGAAYSDFRLLSYAQAYEECTRRRVKPHRTATLPSNRFPSRRSSLSRQVESRPVEINNTVEFVRDEQRLRLSVVLTVSVRNGQGELVRMNPNEVEVHVWTDGIILERSSFGALKFSSYVPTSRSRDQSTLRLVEKVRHKESGTVQARISDISLPPEI